jgi:hypothetical protein
MHRQVDGELLDGIELEGSSLALVSVALKACAPDTFSPWKSELVNSIPMVTLGAAGQAGVGRNFSGV